MDKRGPKPQGEAVLTPAERQARYRGLGSKRTENLCKAVSRNLSQSLGFVRHIFATKKCPARLGRGGGRGT